MLCLADWLGSEEVVLSLEHDLLCISVAPMTCLRHLLPASAQLDPRQPVTEEHNLGHEDYLLRKAERAQSLKLRRCNRQNY